MGRGLAAVLYYVLARYLPPTNAPGGALWTGLRVLLARCFVSSMGKNIDISRMVYLGFGRDIVIGDNSGLGVGAELHGPLRIGSDVMVSPGVIVHTRNHRADDTTVPINSQGYWSPKQVVIEDDVWIGVRAIVLPGVTIGRGSIVGAGAVVTKNVPAFSVAAGNPARVVRSRRKTPGRG